jgi:formiminotetrahydrofolate cyclodeaminase
MEAIIVALIAAVGGILAAMVQKLRVENRSDHGVVASLLKDLHDDVEKVEDKLDKHIDWHLTKK